MLRIIKTYHSSHGDGLENLIDDDSSIENIRIVLSLKGELLTVISSVVDGDVSVELVGTNINKVDSGVWFVVGVVEDEEKVVSDESELDWGDILSELESDLVHVVLGEGVDDQRAALVGLSGVEKGLLVLADTVSVDEVNSSDALDFTVLIDVVDGSLGELSHVENSALLLLWVVAQPVEEVELRVDGEGASPLRHNLAGLEVVDLELVVSW